MSAVIRIKRQLNEDPLDVVLVNCKRRKTEGNDKDNTEELSAVLKLLGTVQDPEEDVFKHIKKPTKAETEDQYKKHPVDLLKKLRDQKQLDSKNSRYKVVNSFRSKNSTLPENSEESSYTIVDIETEDKVESQTNKNFISKEPQYVYDLYYTNSDDFGEVDLNELISVYPLSDGVIYNARDDVYNNESDTDNSDDSNAESNWRNDYPDESEGNSEEEDNDNESITERDMLRAMHRVTLDDNLSDDDYDAAFGYDREEECGSSYSKYKTKSIKCEYYDEYDDSCTP